MLPEEAPFCQYSQCGKRISLLTKKGKLKSDRAIKNQQYCDNSCGGLASIEKRAKVRKQVKGSYEKFNSFLYGEGNKK